MLIIHQIKCKYEHDNKNVKLAEFNIKVMSDFLNAEPLKMI